MLAIVKKGSHKVSSCLAAGSVQEWFQSRQIWQKAAEQESKQKVLSVKEQVSEVLRITSDAKQAILEGDYKQVKATVAMCSSSCSQCLPNIAKLFVIAAAS